MDSAKSTLNEIVGSMKHKEETLTETIEVLSKEKQSQLNHEKDALYAQVAVVFIGIAATLLWAFFNKR